MATLDDCSVYVVAGDIVNIVTKLFFENVNTTNFNVKRQRQRQRNYGHIHHYHYYQYLLPQNHYHCHLFCLHYNLFQQQFAPRHQEY